jgi:hypothetical protein
MGEFKIDNKNEVLFKIILKLNESIEFYEVMGKVILEFNELFTKKKIPLRLKEYNKDLIHLNYSFRLSKKNGYPKLDCPSKEYFF